MDIEERSIKYGVYLGRRYNEKEKKLFLSEIAKDFQELGYTTDARITQHKRFKGINMYIGDVVKAKTLFIAHYDTPLNSFDKNMVFNPFDIRSSERNQQEVPRRHAITAVVVGFTLMVILTMFLNVRGTALSVSLIVITVLMTLAGYLILRGVGNPINTNFNTSGVLALLALAKNKPDDVAFVLTDRECIDNLGDVMLRNALPKSIDDKTIIHLRALGNGKSIVVGHTEENAKLAKTIAKGESKAVCYPMGERNLERHSLSYYDRAVSISVADSFENIWEIRNVFNNQDLEIDMDQFNRVIAMCERYIKTN